MDFSKHPDYGTNGPDLLSLVGICKYYLCYGVDGKLWEFVSHVTRLKGKSKINRRDVTGRIDRIVPYCFINTARKTNFLGLCEKCESLIGSTRYAPISLFQKSRGERSRHSSFRQTLTAVFIFISPFSSFGIDSE